MRGRRAVSRALVTRPKVLLMPLLSKLKIGPRLALAFGLVALVFLVALAIGWTRVGTVAASQGAYSDTANRSNAAAAAAYNMRISQAQNVNVMGRVENEDGSDMHAGDVAAFESALKQLESSGHDATSRAAIATIDGDYARWTNADRRLMALVAKGDHAAATTLGNGPVNALGDTLAQALTRLGSSEASAGDTATADAVAGVRRVLEVIAAIAILVGVALAILATRSIVRPLNRLQEATNTAANGDLTIHLGDQSRDELGAVSRSFDAMVNALREIVGHVSEAARKQADTADEMANASEQSGQAIGQIAATIGEVARGASDQAMATQRVTHTVDEMTVGIGQVAEGGQQAASVATEADTAAAAGSETAAAATEAMRSIEAKVADAAAVVTTLGEKSAAIGDIVSTIGDIAAQTNLLALNAAIEAARAGEQGRGFAVVAEEVRKLAESTGDQAGSIAGLIGEIQAETGRAVEAMNAGRVEVDAGAQRVQAAGDAFEDIRALVVRLSHEVTQVASAAEELETGSKTVREGISSTASVSEENAAAAQEVAASTQETAASGQQIAASAQEMASSARALSAMVARFTV